MTIIQNSTRYEKGNRIVEQTAVYLESDDLIQLAQNQSQLGHTVRRIEELNTKDKDAGEVRELTRLLEEKTRLTEEVKKQQNIVDGYGV